MSEENSRELYSDYRFYTFYDEFSDEAIKVYNEFSGEIEEFYDENKHYLTDLSYSALRDDVHQKAQEYNIPGTGRNDAVDAFRHAYSSAILTYDYSGGFAATLGGLNEVLGNIKGQPATENYMDGHNNAIGRKIGLEARSREEIADLVYQALYAGELITGFESLSPSPPRHSYFDYY